MMAAVHDARERRGRPRGGDRLPPAADLDDPAARREALVPARPAQAAVHAVLAHVVPLRRRPAHPGRLLRAGRRPDPARRQEGAVLGRRRARGEEALTLVRRPPRRCRSCRCPAAARGCSGLAAPATTSYITGDGTVVAGRDRATGATRSSSPATSLDGDDDRPRRLPRPGRRGQRVGVLVRRRAAARCRCWSTAADELGDGRRSSASTSATSADTARGVRARPGRAPTRRSTTRAARRCWQFGALPARLPPTTAGPRPRGPGRGRDQRRDPLEDHARRAGRGGRGRRMGEWFQSQAAHRLAGARRSRWPWWPGWCRSSRRA